MISKETENRVVEAVKIVEVVSEFVTLKKQGANFIGNCPFHNERTPSLVVSPTKERYKCFGCGASGGVISFVMEHEHISYPEAVKWLAKKASIEIKDSYQPTPEEEQKYAHRESLKVAMSFAFRQFAESKSPESIEYLKMRNFTPDTLHAFGIGFAPSPWGWLKDKAKQAGYNEQVLLDASLLTKSEKGVFDFFRNRITFPICDLSGNVIAFSARTLGDEQPKYLNSRESDLYHKGSALFGLHLAKPYIIKSDECVIVEGNFDAMRLHELGIKNVVAPCGTALTPGQIAIIRRFTSNVVLMYDADPAGEKATQKNAELLLCEGMNVRIALLPESEDPDSYGLKNGKKAVEQLICDAVTYVGYIAIKVSTVDDPAQAADKLKDLQRTIASMPDDTYRQMYINHTAKVFQLPVDELVKAIKAVKANKIEDRESGWIALEHAKEAIKQQDLCHVTQYFNELIASHAREQENTVSFKGELEYSHIQELNSLTHNIIVDDLFSILDSAGNEYPTTKLCKRLFSFNFNIIVTKENEQTNFLHAYAYSCQEVIRNNAGDESLRRSLIEQCAELLSRSDNTTITINTKRIADILHIKEAELKKVMKPYLEKKKTKTVFSSEAITIDGVRFDFDPDKLPDYVDRAFYSKWNYFAAQDKNGRKIFYVFRTPEGGLISVGNFFIEPLFHVYDTDPLKNKRIVKINNAENGATFYVEFLSSNLIDFSSFKKFLFNEGGNIFSKGKAHHHEIILASIANQFPRCYELNEFGQQHENFYAFSNAIFSDGKVEYMDELGLVNHQDKVYYSPAFSKIYAGLRKSNDKYENDRYFVYRENTDTTFEQWASLMNQVYKLNDNGAWALVFAMMSAFRSIIYPIDRLFTAPFLIGATESGKTQVAVSIRSLFIHPEAPLFNLNSGTDAAFFSSMERYRDVAMVYEEYNDYQISDIKFQGLKAAVYDGEGKQKKKDASSKDLDISKINCSIVLLGQEAPERDDGSLANRVILLHVPKKDSWTEEERRLFDELKRREKAGLSNVLIEVLKQRGLVSAYYQKTQRECYKRLKQDLAENGDSHQSRLLNTVSLFLAMVKLWEEHVPTLKLPFAYDQFYQTVRAKVITQSESISSTNRLSVFFETLDLLLNKQNNGMIAGREFKIEYHRTVTVQKNRNETFELDLGTDAKILYLRLNIIHPLYADLRKTEALKMNNLRMYLENHPAYIGQIKSTRFGWLEYKEEFNQSEGRVTKVEKAASQNSSAIALNYEILSELNGLDLEKYETDIKPFDQPASETVQVSNNDQQQGSKQPVIPTFPF